MVTKNPDYDVYTVGWICIISSEMNAARALLDEEHESLPPRLMDDNNYLLGRMNGHNVVIGYPGSGLYGPHNASHVATNMARTFPNIRFGLLVGVGGGAPGTADAENTWNDIRLGDVVVSNPKGSHGGVLHYDAGKFEDNGVFHITSHLNRPPSLLLTATQRLRSDHDFELGHMGNYINQVCSRLARLPALRAYRFPGWDRDRLFISSYEHTGEGDCSKCDRAYLAKRLDRESDIPVVHYGLIASGSAVMRSAQRRDQLRDDWDICCFEMEAAGLMDDFPCIVIRGICDYSDGHKNKEWQPYAAIAAAAYAKDLLRVIHPQTVEETVTVLEVLNDVSRTLDKVDLGLSQLTTSVEGVSMSVNKVHKEWNDTSILEWLHPHDFCAEQSKAFSQCQEGTGQWFLDSPTFQKWLNHDNEALLCQGFPGAGKTVISSIIINYLTTQYQNNDDVNITYLYCSFRRQHEQKPADLFAILLKQAALRMETLPACVLKLYKNCLIRRGTRPSCSQILRALATVITACRRSFIVIDALDEHVSCHEDHADFLEGVFELQRQANVNIIATSRYMAEIEDEFKRRNGRFLDIRATNEDVRVYVEKHMFKLQPFALRNPMLVSEIKNKIVENAGGIFLRARLCLNYLQHKTTLSGLQHALQGHPKGSEAYDRVYSEALERITGQTNGFKDLTMRALAWIACARRPLTTRELQYALAIEHDSKDFDQDNVVDVGIIINKCAGLVTVDETSNTIHLVHYTAQAYLERNWRILLPISHGEIAAICIKFLSLHIMGPDWDRDYEELKSRVERYSFYRYAAENWGHHAREAADDDPWVAEIFDDDSKWGAGAMGADVIEAILSYEESRPRKLETTKLELVAWFGLNAKMVEMIRNGLDCDVANNLGMTPLTYAAKNGHLRMVEILLDSGANPCTAVEWGDDPITCAVSKNHEDVIKAILSRAADADAKEQIYGSLLYGIVMGGHDTLAKLVPDIKALQDYRPAVGLSLHSLAAFNGRESLLKLLLDEGLDPNARDYPAEFLIESWRGVTPLMCAATIGHESCIGILLQRGADPNLPDERGKTPLFYAVANEHKPIIKLLVEHGANPLARDDDGWLATFHAAKNGAESVLELLIELGVGLDFISEDDSSAMSVAAECGKTSTVKFLLEHGADPNPGSKCGRPAMYESPLLCAVRKGHVAIVKLLHAHGVSLQDRDEECGRTPLSLAAEHGRVFLVQFLLDRGIDPDSTDVNGSRASNAQNHTGQTPIMWAARRNERETLEVLLDRGADINAKDRHGRTALSWAAQNDCREIVGFLLQWGAELDSQDHYGLTPFTWACEKRHTALIELLLEKGADPSKDAAPSLSDMDADSMIEYMAFLGCSKEELIASMVEGKARVENLRSSSSASVNTLAPVKGIVAEIRQEVRER